MWMFLILITRLFEKFLYTVFLFIVLFKEMPSFLGHSATEWKYTDKKNWKECRDVKLIKIPFNYSYSTHKQTNYIVRPLIYANLLSFSYGFRNRNVNMIRICRSAFCRENISFSRLESLHTVCHECIKAPEKFLRKGNLFNFVQPYSF